MRHQANTCEDIPSRVTPSVPWRLQAVYALDGYRLYVKFIDGLEGSVDLSRLVTSDQAGVFVKLRDPEFFKSVHLCRGASTWPDGLDLAPDAMHDAIQSHGAWEVD